MTQRKEDYTINDNDYLPYIEVNVKKRFGKPCIKGTRITVTDVLEMLAEGMTQADILEEHPNLTTLQIKAALAYASYQIGKGVAA